MQNKKDTTSIIALGGLGEVGKNMYVIHHDDELLIIDAGVMFPEEDLMGVDYVIQDVTYLKEHEKDIKALIITHGHEDHIGGITFLLQNVNVPVIYAPRIAVSLIKHKLEDSNIKYEKIETLDKNSVFKWKHLSVEFITTTHSIPDSFAVVIDTPQGKIFETGDFKFDLTPIGPVADFHKIAKIGSQGVKILLSDSTNALSEGFSKSESCVDETLNDIFSRHNGRIILATFASNIYRIKHIVETCRKYNRQIVVFGRSMDTSINIALDNELIKDKTIFIDANKAKSLKRSEVCILCTGSQGEPLAALSRIANGTHKQISLLPDDLVVFSSKPIPGNAASINRVINKLYLKGVKVFTNQEFSDIHTSGHAKQEELKLMLRLVNPQYFMPMHGEYRMLTAHKELAMECGIPDQNIFICKNGDQIILTNDGVEKGPNVTAGDIYVDGNRIGGVGSSVVRERKLMSHDGILLAIVNINPLTRELLIKPNVTTRGFIMVNENLELIDKIERKISQVVRESIKDKYSYTDLKNQIVLEVSPYISALTGRHPMILPVIMEVKKES